MTKAIEFPSLYLHFFSCYHQGQYWEAHEVLEELWQTQRDNHFYHGLIQIAAIMHQLTRGKIRGARKLAQSALQYLSPYTPQKDGVDVTQVLSWLEQCLLILPANVKQIEGTNFGIEKCPLPSF